MKKIFLLFTIMFMPLYSLAGNDIYLNINGKYFDPLKLTESEKIIKGNNYYILQCTGPILPQWKKEIKNLNVDFYDYIPNFAFIVKTNSSNISAIKSLPYVRWIGYFGKEYRVDSRLGKSSSGSIDVQASFFSGCDIESYISQIKILGSKIIASSSNKWGSTLILKIKPSLITKIAEFKDLKWIGPKLKAKPNNNIASDIIGVRSIRKDYGLYGEGQVIGICDSGLDQGSTNPDKLLADFQDGAGNSRIKEILDVSGDGTADLYDGHGTHVAGSVLGNGLLSGSNPDEDYFPETCMAGMAPKAEAVIQASDKTYIADDGTTKTYIGYNSTLYNLFKQSKNAGSHLHTNSWGTALQSLYTEDSMQTDQYLWDNKNFLILFSAGNAGIDFDNDGIVDLYSIGSPGTAKNCLTVGASESIREEMLYKYGKWPSNFPAEPLTSDLIADNKNGMAAFSSRGPTRDGRIKPDIVAPGTLICSTKASKASGKFSLYEENNNYAWMSGTSMSTPITAGAVALLREYLIKENKRTSPSSALLKAALTNSAFDMNPGQYGSGSGQEMSCSAPNNVQGWGRLDLEKALYPQSPFAINYYDQKTGIETGMTDEISLTINSSSEPLRVNLAWTDYPGTPATQGALVNDLDLSIEDPSGIMHYPDNKQGQSHIYYSHYNKEEELEGEAIFNAVAVYFDPDTKPFKLESVGIVFNQPGEYSANINLKVYEKEIKTENLLYTKSLVYRDNENLRDLGYITFDIDYEEYIDNDIYIVIEDDSEYISIQYSEDESGYSFIKVGEVNGTEVWGEASVEFAVETTISIASTEQNFDHTNNIVGITIPSPALGDYKVKVTGYNVPYGPQPYALVASGNIEPQTVKSLNAIKNCQITAVTEQNQDSKEFRNKYNIETTTKSEQLKILSFNATTSDDLSEFAFNKNDFTQKYVHNLFLYKLIDNEHKQFTYSTAGNSDGTWWLEDSNNNKLSWDSQIDTTKTYELHFVIKDNGNFDLDDTAGKIYDPQTLIEADVEENSSSSSSGSSGGCIFNSQSGLGLEWLILALGFLALRAKFRN